MEHGFTRINNSNSPSVSVSIRAYPWLLFRAFGRRRLLFEYNRFQIDETRLHRIQEVSSCAR